MGVNKENVDMVKDGFFDKFHENGLTVPAADEVLSRREERAMSPDEERITAAQAKRARKQASRKLLARRAAMRNPTDD